MPRNQTLIFAGLTVLLAALAALSVALPGIVPTGARLPLSRPAMAAINAAVMLVLYGGLGLLGLRLAARLGFAPLWTGPAGARARLVTPALWGLVLGADFVLADTIFSQFHSLGPLPHPPFPTSLVASASAGIGEEMIFRLFLIPALVWLISSLLLHGRHRTGVFWLATAISAFGFAFGHLPSALALTGLASPAELPLALWAEILLLNGALSVGAAVFLRRAGFLAAVSLHFWTDVVWHVIWGPLAG